MESSNTIQIDSAISGKPSTASGVGSGWTTSIINGFNMFDYIDKEGHGMISKHEHSMGFTEILNVGLRKDGTVSVDTRVANHNMVYTTYPTQSVPDQIMRWIFKYTRGKWKLIKKVQGEHHPATTTIESFTINE